MEWNWMAWAPVGTRSQFHEEKAAFPTQRRVRVALVHLETNQDCQEHGSSLTAGLQYKVDHRNDQQAHALLLWKLDQSKNWGKINSTREPSDPSQCENPLKRAYAVQVLAYRYLHTVLALVRVLVHTPRSTSVPPPEYRWIPLPASAGDVVFFVVLAMQI